MITQLNGATTKRLLKVALACAFPKADLLILPNQFALNYSLAKIALGR